MHEIDKSTTVNFLLLDSLPKTYSKNQIYSFNTAEYYPLYIGKENDTIVLNTTSLNIKKFRNYDFQKYQRLYNNKQISIVVDTNVFIGSLKWHSIIRPKSNRNEVFPAIIKSYPIKIKNLSKDTINIGYGEFVPLVLEIKIQNGTWSEIEMPYTYDCGTGISDFYLLPNQILITALKITEGDTKVKMRIRYAYTRLENLVISNEFERFIQKSFYNEISLNSPIK